MKKTSATNKYKVSKFLNIPHNKNNNYARNTQNLSKEDVKEENDYTSYYDDFKQTAQLPRNNYIEKTQSELSNKNTKNERLKRTVSYKNTKQTKPDLNTAPVSQKRPLNRNLSINLSSVANKPISEPEKIKPTIPVHKEKTEDVKKQINNINNDHSSYKSYLTSQLFLSIRDDFKFNYDPIRNVASVIITNKDNETITYDFKLEPGKPVVLPKELIKNENDREEDYHVSKLQTDKLLHTLTDDKKDTKKIRKTHKRQNSLHVDDVNLIDKDNHGSKEVIDLKKEKKKKRVSFNQDKIILKDKDNEDISEENDEEGDIDKLLDDLDSIAKVDK